MNIDNAVWFRLLDLVQELPTAGVSRILGRKALTRTTHLVSDLGLHGDDAFEFMEKYAERFGVKRGDYNASNYFEPESLWLLPRLRKHQPVIPITLGMLELAACEGEWHSEKLHRLLG